jgi:DNA polymerase III subunit beta
MSATTAQTTPHLMTRAVPGDTRCSECGLTAGTKAHRAGREAAKAPAPAPAVEAAPEVPAAPAESRPTVVGPVLPAGDTVLPAAMAGLHHVTPDPDATVGPLAALGLPAVTLPDTATVAASYADWSTAELCDRLPRLLTTLARLLAAGDTQEAFRVAFQMRAEAVALGERANRPADFPLDAYLGDDAALTVTPAQAGAGSDPEPTPAPAAPPTAPAAGAPDQGPTLRPEPTRRRARAGATAQPGAVRTLDTECPAGDTPAVTVARKPLQDALTWVAGGIPKRPGLPVLAMALMRVTGHVVRFDATDLDATRGADVPAGAGATGGTVCVPITTLRAWVKGLPREADTVRLTAGAGGELTVTAGTGDSELTQTFGMGPVQDLAPHLLSLPALDGHLTTAGLVDMGMRAAATAAPDDTHPALTGVRVTAGASLMRSASTDRYRLQTSEHTYTAVSTFGETVRVMPAAAVIAAGKVLAKHAERGHIAYHVGTHGGKDVAAFSAGGYRIITLPPAEHFPPVEKIIPAGPVSVVTVTAGALRSAVKDACRWSTGAKWVRKSRIPVVLHLADAAGAAISYRRPDPHCHGDAAVPNVVTVRGDVPAEVGANPRYLMEALDTFGDDTRVTLGFGDTATKPFTITSPEIPGYMHLIMPIRINADEPVRPVPAPKPQDTPAPAPAPGPHAFTSTGGARCTVAGCGAGRRANIHATAYAAQRAATAQRMSAGTPAPSLAPGPAVTGVDVDGVRVAVTRRVDISDTTPAVTAPAPLGSGSWVLDNRGGVTRINRADRRKGIDGWLIENGGYPHFAPAASVKAAIVGDTVCMRPTGHGCGLAHAGRNILFQLPWAPGATAPAVGSGDSAPAPARLVDATGLVSLSHLHPAYMSAPILPAGALAATVGQIGPHRFAAYREQINDCACTVCTELSYKGHHWVPKREGEQAARVLLAHLEAGTHVHVTHREHGAYAKAHRASEVARAVAAGITGEALERIRDPHRFAVQAGRDLHGLRSGVGIGLGIGNAPIRAEREARLKAEREAETAVTVDQGETTTNDTTTDTDSTEDTIMNATTTAPAIVSPADFRPYADDMRGCTGPLCAAFLAGVRAGDMQAPALALLDALSSGMHAVMDAPAATPAPASVAPAETDAAAVELPAVELPALEMPEVRTVRLIVPDSDTLAAGGAPVEPVRDVSTGEAPADGLDTHGAHAHRVYVSGGDTAPAHIGDGYRFHMVPGAGVKSLAKAVRVMLGQKRALFGKVTFNVTAPAKGRAVNIVAAPGYHVADWAPVLAEVASVLGAEVDRRVCEGCDQAPALVDA